MPENEVLVVDRLGAVCGPVRRGMGLRALACVTAIVAVLACTAQARAAGPASYFQALPASGSSELQTGRQGAVAAPLPNGQVLIAGGATIKGVILQSAELFDPTTDTFTALPASGSSELQTARVDAVAAPLPNGRVLIAGGQDNNGDFLQSAELFDPTTDTFTALPASANTELQSAREGAVAVPLQNGQVLIAGGNTASSFVPSAELFDPTTDTFTALPASGGSELQTPRSFAVAAPLQNGKVLIAGGLGGGPGSLVVLQSAELFDPTTDTFTALPASGSSELQTARWAAAAAPLANGQVLIAGGATGTSTLQSAELFDPATDTFASLPASGDSELQSPRKQASAVALANGQVLFVGGDTGSAFLPGAELFWSSPQAHATGGSFGDQTASQPSTLKTVQITNIGAQALSIAGVSLAGTNPSDFTITADGCAPTTLSFGQSCAITVRFTPAASGTRSATIALQDNESTPASIALSGNGVASNGSPTGASDPQGSAGANGTGGAQGATGATGSQGPMGASGARGPAGPAGSSGKIELVTCTQKNVTVNHKHKITTNCTTRLVSATVTLKTTASNGASLTRGRVVYATGVVTKRSRGVVTVVVTPLKALPAGKYTLTTRAKIGKRIVILRTQITLR